MLNVQELIGFGAGSVPLSPTWSITAGAITTGYLQASPMSVAYPASISAGDLLLIGIRFGAPRTPSASGFTSAATMGGYQWWMWKVATGSESGSLSVSWTGGNADFTSQILRVRPSVGTPRFYAQTTGAYGDPCSGTAPTKLGNDLTILMDSAYTDGSTLTSAPSGFTQISYQTTPGPTFYSGYHANVTPGATLVTDWTMASGWWGCTVTVEP